MKIMLKIINMHKDFSLAYLFNVVLNIVLIHASTIISRIYAFWWGVEILDHSKFYGLPYFKKHHTAKIRIGHHVTLRSSQWSNTIGLNRKCYFSASRDAKIVIGNHCGFSGVVLSSSSSIVIGNYVICGANCTIVDNDRHPLSSFSRRNRCVSSSSPVVIGDDVFLGMNVVVLKGCIIGSRTVVAANSVVTRSFPSDVLVGGNPAKIIKKIQ